MARKETNYIFALASVTLLLCCIEALGKPALNEENRNLCESEPDKAECIREVEEAKGTEQVDGDHQQGEESNGGDDGYTMEEYLAKMDKVRRESEENRKFWKEELRSMNKWEKYGLG
ncbi:unnamed protein product [Porites evermanni]|uniref:Uncharacterized protein n=1 Tax=Porites evermanni TaxID=104178 RepID=A0ABN8Q7D1_9CNID|nr:unnamed protein product [Porites evermanni]